MNYELEKFELGQFNYLLRALFCISQSRFIELYKKIFGDNPGIESYAKEKFNLITSKGPAYLICEWDYQTLYKAMQYLVVEKSV